MEGEQAAVAPAGKAVWPHPVANWRDDRAGHVSEDGGHLVHDRIAAAFRHDRDADKEPRSRSGELRPRGVAEAGKVLGGVQPSAHELAAQALRYCLLQVRARVGVGGLEPRARRIAHRTGEIPAAYRRHVAQL